MTPALPDARDLVLIGGGHAHALVLRRWGMRPLPGARLTLIDPHPVAPYTGMLPGHVAGHYPLGALEIDLVRLARHAGARIVLGRAAAVDVGAATVEVAGRPPIAWDVLSIDVGITSAMPDLPGFAEHAVPAKPLGRYAAAWDRFVDEVETGEADATVAVIGGGVAGVELAMAMAHRLRDSSPRVTLIEASETLLGGAGGPARAALLRHMDRLGIACVTGASVAWVEAGAVVLGDGRRVASALTVGAAGARPLGLAETTGLPLTDGFLDVGPTLQSTGDARVFAAGDCAHMGFASRPKAGVFAVRQAPVLAHNLRAALGGGRLRRYRPQRRYLKLVSTGGRGAVADRFGLALDGGWLWRWKDRIDRRFMDRLGELPAMPAAPLPRFAASGALEAVQGAPAPCGGCAAKVGRGALDAGLTGLAAPLRADVISGPGDDAAVLTHGLGRQVLTVDLLRAFTEDAWLLARVAAVHAMGDVWAMGAAPQAALATIVLPPLTPRLQARTIAEIMAAAAEAFRLAGADVVGGHTSVGAELAIGFAVTGTAARTIGKSGARPGDALILSKAIGTGTILAAEMARAGPGPVIAGAWAAMQHGVGAAAAVLAPEAHAMTDVTGFGLAGHLLELLDASGVAAELDLDTVPCLPGAADLVVRHPSSLHAANAAAAAPRMALPDGPRGQLLFDPQTAGGLLAAVPAAAAAALLARLLDAGETAAIVGRVVAGPPSIKVR